MQCLKGLSSSFIFIAYINSKLYNLTLTILEKGKLRTLDNYVTILNNFNVIIANWVLRLYFQSNIFKCLLTVCVLYSDFISLCLYYSAFIILIDCDIMGHFVTWFVMKCFSFIINHYKCHSALGFWDLLFIVTEYLFHN